MTLEEAFKRKGEAVTQIEIWQVRLAEANSFIKEHIKLMARAAAPKVEIPKEEVPDSNGFVQEADRL